MFLIWNRPDILSVFSYVLSIICFGLCCILSNAVLSISFATSFTDGQSLYFIYFVLFTSASAWLIMLLASTTAIIPDLAIKLVDNVRESEKIKKLKSDYLRNAYYRTKTLKNKKPKFLKYITLPSFSNGASANVASARNRASTTIKENKNYIQKYLRQISSSSKVSVNNILSSNILKPSKSRQHTFTNTANNLNEREETVPMNTNGVEIELTSLKSNTQSITSGGPKNGKNAVTFSVDSEETASNSANKTGENRDSEPKLKSVKQAIEDSNL